MSQSAADPSGSTEQFQAFAHQHPQSAPAPSNAPLVIGIVIGAVALVALVAVVVLFLL